MLEEDLLFCPRYLQQCSPNFRCYGLPAQFIDYVTRARRENFDGGASAGAVEKVQVLNITLRLALLWQMTHGQSAFGGPTMRSILPDWEIELARWLKPFLEQLGHKARRRMCPLYVAGLIGPGDRKSVQPMAERLAPGDYDQLHHFVAAGVWDAAPLEKELLVQADKLVGGSDAVLVIDDTAVPKKGKHSVGVAWQYASALGKNANCQTLVSLTLARDEVPVMVALRLFLPESWTSDLARLKRAGVAVEYRTARTKPERSHSLRSIA